MQIHLKENTEPFAQYAPRPIAYAWEEDTKELQN